MRGGQADRGTSSTRPIIANMALRATHYEDALRGAAVEEKPRSAQTQGMGEKKEKLHIGPQKRTVRRVTHNAV